MKKIKHFILLFTTLFMMNVGMASVVAAAGQQPPQTVTCNRILTFPCWYEHLPVVGGQPQVTKLDDIWIIVLNVLDILIQVAGYVAMGYIIWGGFKYIKSQGDPAKIKEAKDAILNAAIGLVIAIIAVGIVQLVAGNIN